VRYLLFLSLPKVKWENWKCPNCLLGRKSGEKHKKNGRNVAKGKTEKRRLKTKQEVKKKWLD
jgi:hypothetical protein